MIPLNSLDFYYFSPTGGTKKIGETLANNLATSPNFHNLANPKENITSPTEDILIVAMPVYGGRIPSFAVQKLSNFKGNRQKVITLVVYGTRAFEDALLELNNLMKSLGFQILASGAFVAQHSIASEIGTGRPDKNDEDFIADFSKKILSKIEKGENNEVVVSGNYPYKADFSMPVTPISLQTCNLCRRCISVCPTEAISIADDKIVTDVEKCILCMACVRYCPIHARILPPPLQEKISQMLAKFKDIRRENEIFI